MIIDGNGHVRWIATGYYGSPTALADEISIIIEEIKKEVPPKFREENIVFHGKDTLRYGATLTVPDTPGKHPAIVIASGTYPQDRDGSMAGHKIYKQIAEYLSSKGIAVLRVDDRGVGESNGVYADATTADFAGDVIAGVEYLKSRHDIDRRKIGVLGHSEGGAYDRRPELRHTAEQGHCGFQIVRPFLTSCMENMTNGKPWTIKG